MSWGDTSPGEGKTLNKNPRVVKNRTQYIFLSENRKPRKEIESQSDKKIREKQELTVSLHKGPGEQTVDILKKLASRRWFFEERGGQFR